MEYIIEKGSACIEAFRDVTQRVSRYFGNPDLSRRAKEMSFEEDMRVLIEDMERRAIHKAPKARMVPALNKKSAKKPQEPTSAIIDVQVAGAEIWQGGKFKEFLRSTTFDPKIGYPIPSPEDDEHDDLLDSNTVFDSTVTNPLECNNYVDLHGDEDEDSTFTALGGGSEYATGVVLI